MKSLRYGFIFGVLLMTFSWAVAAQRTPPRRPIERAQRTMLSPRHLDDESVIALTIAISGGDIRLRWCSFPDVPYWKVLRSLSPMMTAAEILAVIPDTFWTDTQALLIATSCFYQVIPLFTEPQPDTIIIIEDFEDGSVTLESIPGQDDDPSDWQVTSTDAYNGTDYSLRLFGDTWKKEIITPIEIEFGTVWEVAMKLIRRGEMQAFGVADSINYMWYIIWGSEAPQAQVWITTYQGWFESDEWIPIYLPIGEDWHGRFGYLPRIRELHYINDNDNTSPEGEVRFDEIRDITGGLPCPPVSDFDWTIVGSVPPDSVRVQFSSLAHDPDSPILDHLWEFGDGRSSALMNPEHVYKAHGMFTATLTVTDETDNVAWYSEAVVDSPVTQSREFRFAFVGDVMLARGYDSWDVEDIFDPTRHLTLPLDLASCNLESPLTTATTQHPTKGICLKADPDKVAGVKYAGFDFACLANNHIFDYLENGMYETMLVLDTAGVIYTGCGANDLLARRTRFMSCNGISLAMLAFSDRTGSYNNYQPFLDAGRSRPGFAMWNRSAIEATIPEADALSDFVVLNVHSGSEYKTEPQVCALTGLPPWDPEIIVLAVVPDTNERKLRQYAIENGADLVITHHPHIIQGFEVYQGKLIAHSLGNFAFDLTYAECFPSLIVHTHFSGENGIDQAIVHPVYLDDWVPKPATGGLGQAILDYESEMSRRLDTWLVHQPGEDTARVIFDTTTVSRTGTDWTDTLTLTQSGSYWMSPAWKMDGDGYAVSVEIVSPSGAQVRVGRDLLWFGNMENEGATPWNFNSSDEGFSSDQSHSGLRSTRLRRAHDAPDNVTTQLDYRKPLDSDFAHSLVGWMKTENAGDATMEAQCWQLRSGGSNPLAQTVVGPISGTNPWTLLSADMDIPSSTGFFNIRLSLYPPQSGTGYAWFDDLALVQWENWQTSPHAVPFPSDFTFFQIRTSSPATQAIVHYRREWIP